MTRHEVLGQAVDQCMKEIYSYAQPSINWNDFIQENKDYIPKEKSWEQYRKLLGKKKENTLSKAELGILSSYPTDWEYKSITECIGPKPYEFYYIPKEIMKDICDSYVYAYNIDSQQELLNIIDILKNYCKDPIVDKYIEDKGKPGDEDWKPGHRGYGYPDNLQKEIFKILRENSNYWKNAISETNPEDLSQEIVEKFFKFLDMAGDFYNWNRDLNSFNMSVYLGASPNSNKEAVIENWKKYRDKDIEIDEEQIKKEYYGDDYDE